MPCCHVDQRVLEIWQNFTPMMSGRLCVRLRSWLRKNHGSVPRMRWILHLQTSQANATSTIPYNPHNAGRSILLLVRICIDARNCQVNALAKKSSRCCPDTKTPFSPTFCAGQPVALTREDPKMHILQAETEWEWRKLHDYETQSRSLLNLACPSDTLDGTPCPWALRRTPSSFKFAWTSPDRRGLWQSHGRLEIGRIFGVANVVREQCLTNTLGGLADRGEDVCLLRVMHRCRAKHGGNCCRWWGLHRDGRLNGGLRNRRLAQEAKANIASDDSGQEERHDKSLQN